MEDIEKQINKGKLTLVDTPNGVKDWAKNYCQSKGIKTIISYNRSWIEQFNDSFHNKFLITDNRIYKLDNTDILLEAEWLEIKETSKNTYEYLIKTDSWSKKSLKDLIKDLLKKNIKNI